MEDGSDPIASLGLIPFRPILPPIVGEVVPGGAAAIAGLMSGDTIVSINGQPITSWPEVVQAVRESPLTPLNFELERNGKRLQFDISPAKVREGEREIGRIGAMPHQDIRNDLLITVHYGPLSALGKAFEETWDKSIFNLQTMGKMVTGQLSWRNISGPITIADYAGQSAKLGVNPYLKFLALVSICLGVLNLLPIPVLDGGHLLYYALEILRGKPLTEQCMVIGQKIGLALILMLATLAFYNDFARIIPKLMT